MIIRRRNGKKSVNLLIHRLFDDIHNIIMMLCVGVHYIILCRLIEDDEKKNEVEEMNRKYNNNNKIDQKNSIKCACCSTIKKL